MRLPQLQRPLQAAVLNRGFRPVLTSFTVPIRPTLTTPSADGDGVVYGRRYAAVKAQGAYRIPNKKTIAKKLGAKKTGDQFVIPGNIIFKQRGTIWHPGENAIRGRDHTIHAAATGYVKYYRDPDRHPDKQYIGVAFNKEDKLPYPKNEPRRRKLGMVAHVRKPSKPSERISPSGIPTRVTRKGGLYNVMELEKQVWDRDKAREIAEANQAAAAANAAKRALSKGKKAPAGEAVSPEAIVHSAGSSVPRARVQPGAAAPGEAVSPDTFAAQVAAAQESVAAPTTTSNASAPAGGAQKRKGSKKKKFITPLAFIQKRWLERRRTKVLYLNSQNYAYVESNAAIGRLASRTMYTPPWKLGGRKARFRSRRSRREQKIKQAKENKAIVKNVREKERIAEEAKKAARLAKQRARGAAQALKAAAAEKAAETPQPAVPEGEEIAAAKAEQVKVEEVKAVETEEALPVGQEQVKAEDAKNPNTEKPDSA